MSSTVGSWLPRAVERKTRSPMRCWVPASAPPSLIRSHTWVAAASASPVVAKPIPVLGIAAFIPAWLTALGTGSSFLKFVTPLSYPASEAGLAIGIRYIIGLVVLAYLHLRHPERLPEMRRVFADDLPDQPIPSRDTP
jgi:hypothetical protein